MKRFWLVGASALTGVYGYTHGWNDLDSMANKFSLLKQNFESKLDAKTLLIDKSIDRSQDHQGVVKQHDHKSNLRQCIKQATETIDLYRTRSIAPGLVIAVAHQGKEIWSTGIGYADLESGAKATDQTVMRIASISKSITMFLLGRLLEEGRIDLDKPIAHYLGNKFPAKRFENQPVDITLRQLVSHMGGIRHYRDSSECTKYTTYYKTIYEGLEPFKNDDLVARPGTKYVYTTYGFTLISAVLQSVLEPKSSFTAALMELCQQELGMRNTTLDENSLIIPKRARFYSIVNRRLVNAAQVDNSYKWAGGGLLSNVHDLVKFGRAMLSSYRGDEGAVLRSSTLKQFWTPVIRTTGGGIPEIKKWCDYGMGWFLVNNEKDKQADLRFKEMIFHSGSATGGTSFLLILPEEDLVVAVIVNLDQCPGLGTLCVDIASIFKKGLESKSQFDLLN